MTCPRCGGRIIRDNDLLERYVCLNCGCEPDVLARAALCHRKGLVRRARMVGETRRRDDVS